MSHRLVLFVCCLLVVTPGVAAAQSPDLTVTAATVPASGSVGAAQSTFTVKYTLQNRQGSVAVPFTVTFFYCPSQNTTGCLAVSPVHTISSWFGPNQSRTLTSPSLTVPNGVVYGSRYLRVWVDSGKTVGESDENNNDLYRGISITAHPDLSVSSLTLPASLAPGQSFVASVTVANKAKTSAVASPFSLTYAYCPTSTGGGCTLLGSEQLPGGIPAGGSMTVNSKSLALPKTAPGGTHYLRVTVDSTKVIAEADENNNERRTAFLVKSNKVDLTVGTITVPVTGNTKGADSQFTLDYQVTNRASVSMSKAFTVSFYYCPGKAASGCSSIGKQAIKHSFPPDGSVKPRSPTLKLPVNAAVGIRYVRVFIDSTDAVSETNEGNNNGYAAITVSTLPDLLVATATVPFSGSITGPGSTFTGRYILRNKASTSAFSKAFSVSFSYCPGNAPTGCTSMGKSLTINTSFNSGAVFTVTTPTLTLPSSATPGTRYILAKVDSGGAVSESDESNNNDLRAITVSGNKPDFVAPSLIVSGSGRTVTYTAKVCNSGGSTANNTTVKLFYDRKTQPDCKAKADYTWPLGVMKSGACSPMSHVRNKVAPGRYTAWVLADGTCSVTEAKETNNHRSTSYQVTAPSDAGRDGKVADAGGDLGPGGDAAVDGKASDQGGGSEAGWVWPDTGIPDAGPDAGPPPSGSSGCAVTGSADLWLMVLMLAVLRRRRRCKTARR